VTTVHLPRTWTERLINLPESGMGYQKVNIVLKRGRVLKNVIVLNAEEAQVPESFDPSEIADVHLAR
jgi:hypothetical protein